MASSSGYQPMPGWYWPDLPETEEDSAPGTEPSSASAGSESRRRTQTGQNSQSGESSQTGQSSQSRRRFWPPRQCRICLETVQPTYHTPSEHLPGIFQGAPNVTYESEEGRLIRPCKCKGSSKYVHEGCLQAWRYSDRSMGRRTYWQCPTCGFQYRLARMGMGRVVASVGTQIVLTVAILFAVVFVLGFVADPIINLYLDPWGFIGLAPTYPNEYYYDDDEASSWTEHFLKGFTSMGVIGFLKVLLASPFSYFRINSRRGRATGRDRYEQVSWLIILIGVATFLAAIYRGVRAWSVRILERAGERIMDVGNDDDDDEDDEEPAPPETS